MGNARYYQFLYSKTPMLTFIDGQVSIGASGAVGTVSGNGVQGITKLATGIYKLQLVENYNAYIGGSFEALSPLSGSNVTDGSFVSGTFYQITALGTTNWTAIGLPAGLTAAVGQCFVATGVGGAGAGTAKVVSNCATDVVEVAQNPQLMLQTNTVGAGAVLIFQTFAIKAAAFTGDTATNTTISNLSSFNGLVAGQAISGAGIPLGATIATVGASTLTLSAATTATTATVPMTATPAQVLSHPVSGSIIRFNLMFRNSSNQY